MERKQLIAGGAAVVAIVIALVVFMMIRSDGEDATTPAADVSITASDSPSPSTATTTAAAPTTKSADPTTATPSSPATSAPATSAPATNAAPTKPSTGNVFARPPATVQSRANNTYTFYVEQINPLDSAVDVHLTNGETALTLHCPAPVSPGNCQVSWTTGSHQLTLNYYVTVDPVDPSYQTYTSRPLQFTTG
jgi:hypothetical protein